MRPAVPPPPCGGLLPGVRLRPDPPEDVMRRARMLAGLVALTGRLILVAIVLTLIWTFLIAGK